MRDLPTYVVLLTRGVNGGPTLTHIPTMHRIVHRFEPRDGRAGYPEALALATEIRRAGGWALAVEEAELHLYEPTPAPA